MSALDPRPAAEWLVMLVNHFKTKKDGLGLIDFAAAAKWYLDNHLKIEI